MTNVDIQQLFNRWCNDEASSEDIERLEALFRSGEADHQLGSALEGLWNLRGRDNIATDIESAAIADKILHSSGQSVRFLRNNWIRYAAAILLLIIGAGVIYMMNDRSKTEITHHQMKEVAEEIMPGSDKAILTLSNGNQVAIDQLSAESIYDGDMVITNKNGRLSYQYNEVVATNTMTTPRGGQYMLVLNDGTRAWLNAASSISYPTAFLKDKREVSITGEVYFEVAKNEKKPFVVNTRDEVITVLGTSFNVNAYEDESTSKTSLAEGMLKINNELIRPGQAYVNKMIVSTNIDQDIAWKNGVFNFNRVPLKQVMRQIGRWYDVEIVYHEEVTDFEFYGKMGRDLTLTEILKILSRLGVKFRQEGKNIIVE